MENLSPEQRSEITPLQAQWNAFEYLTICESIQDVKETYPDEPLFQNLKEAEQTKANRGFLYDVRLGHSNLLKSGETLLDDGQNSLSVYLLKKIFLEGKTISEINEMSK